MTVQTRQRLLDTATACTLRPRFEGTNINVWMGFKHINYLAEEAVLEHFRACGVGASMLFAEYGLCWEPVHLDTRIRTSFQIDDLVEATVTPQAAGGVGNELAFQVDLHIDRAGQRRNAARSRVRVMLRHDRPRGDGSFEAIPEPLREVSVERIARTSPDLNPRIVLPAHQFHDRVSLGDDAIVVALTRHSNSFAWRRRIPYFYCHFSHRLQLSGYLRQLEEVVDLFLADRGISIRTLLEDQGWVPMVTHSSVEMLDEALMEEDLYTVFTVEEIFKNLTYTARMDNYVIRNGQLLRTGTGRITHGYARIENHDSLRLVEFDQRMLSALHGAHHADR